jgi:hypothetical protein
MTSESTPEMDELRSNRDWWEAQYWELLQRSGDLVATFTAALFKLKGSPNS